ncbi:sugar nucleotide-binding protein [Aeromonas caviae]|uniref:sugar nucleotide-binding protein n=1 Tax=Aeromonas caviae TaxID=648 RepID=UPI003AF55B25
MNAAAYTQVDQAQVVPELAYRVNTQAVAKLADAAKRVGALLVHFSTDYVFDGSGDRSWREEDKPAPLNVYGLSGVVDQIRRWMAVPQPVDTTQFTGWRTGIPSPVSLFITFTPARISPTWAL